MTREMPVPIGRESQSDLLTAGVARTETGAGQIPLRISKAARQSKNFSYSRLQATISKAMREKREPKRIAMSCCWRRAECRDVLDQEAHMEICIARKRACKSFLRSNNGKGALQSRKFESRCDHARAARLKLGTLTAPVTANPVLRVIVVQSGRSEAERYYTKRK